MSCSLLRIVEANLRHNVYEASAEEAKTSEDLGEGREVSSQNPHQASKRP